MLRSRRQKVRKATMARIYHAKTHNCWTKIAISEALRRGLIDINKGDLEHMIVRCQFVGKDFNTGDAEGLFVGHLPSEALRVLLSDVPTIGNANSCMMTTNVARVFF